ncbi:MAG: GNAT family N-acetyltransferase [Candidatus Poribacteria bacterium]|nr:GNAT family N-acetyltransferase [Candidatus Poribacteria bacterium]
MSLCVQEGDALVAVAHWRLPNADNPDRNDDAKRSCDIQWIVAAPHAEHAVSRLLNEIETKAARAMCRTLSASGRNPLGVGWFGTPTTWRSVSEGLRRARFQPTGKWLLMFGDTYAPQTTSIPGATFRWNADERAGEWTVEAVLDGDAVGECSVWAIPRPFDGCGEAGEWMTLEWLGVEEAWQRRGIGRALLAEQRRFWRERGARHLLLWTETDNLPLQALASYTGFRFAPECWQWEKSVEPA